MIIPNNFGSEREASGREHGEAAPAFGRGPGIGSVDAALATVRPTASLAA